MAKNINNCVLTTLCITCLMDSDRTHLASVKVEVFLSKDEYRAEFIPSVYRQIRRIFAAYFPVQSVISKLLAYMNAHFWRVGAGEHGRCRFCAKLHVARQLTTFFDDHLAVANGAFDLALGVDYQFVAHG